MTSGSHEMIHPLLPFQRSLFQEIEGFNLLQPPLKPMVEPRPCVVGPVSSRFFLGWARLPLPQKQLTTWKVFAGQIGCNSDACYLRSMLEFHKRSSTQHVFNHPTTIYLLQVPLGWKHPKIPSYPIAFFSYGQSKTMHIEYNLIQSIFISICISVYLCCLYFYIYIYIYTILHKRILKHVCDPGLHFATLPKHRTGELGPC